MTKEVGIWPRNTLICSTKQITYIYRWKCKIKIEARIIFASPACFANTDHQSSMLQKVGLSSDESPLIPIKKDYLEFSRNYCWNQQCITVYILKKILGICIFIFSFIEYRNTKYLGSLSNSAILIKKPSIFTNLLN